MVSRLSAGLIIGLACTILWGPAVAESAKAGPDPHRLEIGALPALSGDTDIGFGFGAIMTLARFAPNHKPYKWRLEALWFMTVKGDPEGDGVEFPYHSDYLILDMPGLAGGRLRLTFDGSFRRYTTSGYFGFGSGAKVDSEAKEQNGRYHMYDRIYPALEVKARVNFGSNVSLFVGTRFVYNWINIYEGSQLQGDIARARGDRELGALLVGAEGHYPVLELSLGWIYDSRDHEYAPTRGMFHEVSWRVAPGEALGLDHPFGGLNLTTRFYQSIFGEYLVFAGRLMADLIVGTPPFFELSNHGGYYREFSLGGAKGIRGIPQQRYHGKVKLVANGELRSKLLPFSWGSERFNLGGVAFFDMGQVFAALESTDFDGDAFSLKYGLGGGLRFQWGETFIVRADVAWSPDADPFGLYIDISHIF